MAISQEIQGNENNHIPNSAGIFSLVREHGEKARASEPLSDWLGAMSRLTDSVAVLDAVPLVLEGRATADYANHALVWEFIHKSNLIRGSLAQGLGVNLTILSMMISP